jgi:hypothetical protein
MATVPGQLLLGNIVGRGRVEIRSNRGGAGTGESHIATGAMKERQQQPDSQRQDERQPLPPASVIRAVCEPLRHVAFSEGRSPGIFKA